MKRTFIATSLVGLALGCSAAPPDAPRAAPASPPAAARGGSAVLATFEGSFDAASGELHLVYRTPAGTLMTEESFTEGKSAGDVYLHTEGTNGDNQSDPPSYSAGVLNATVDAENGTGVVLGDLTANITSIVPATTGMVTGGSTSCTGASLGGGANAFPCAVAYGTVPNDATFPAAVLTSPEPWRFSSVVDFVFSGTVTGSPGCTSDGDCASDDCVCGEDSGDCAGGTGVCGAGKGVFATASINGGAATFAANAFAAACTSVIYSAWGSGGGPSPLSHNPGGGGAYVGGSFSGLTPTSTIDVLIGLASNSDAAPGYGGAGGEGDNNPNGGPGGGVTTLTFGATTVDVGGGGGGGTGAGVTADGYGGSQPGESGGFSQMNGQVGGSAIFPSAGGGGGGGGLRGGLGGSTSGSGGQGGSSTTGPGITVVGATSATAANDALFDYTSSCPAGTGASGGHGCVVIRCE